MVISNSNAKGRSKLVTSDSRFGYMCCGANIHEVRARQAEASHWPWIFMGMARLIGAHRGQCWVVVAPATSYQT